MPKHNHLAVSQLIHVLSDLMAVHGDLPVAYIHRYDDGWDDKELITQAYLVEKADVYEYKRPMEIICVDS